MLFKATIYIEKLLAKSNGTRLLQGAVGRMYPEAKQKIGYSKQYQRETFNEHDISSASKQLVKLDVLIGWREQFVGLSSATGFKTTTKGPNLHEETTNKGLTSISSSLF